MVNAVVSDLFFNYEKKAIFPSKKNKITLEEYKSAIWQEACEFCDAYGSIISAEAKDEGFGADRLTNDFMRRL